MIRVPPVILFVLAALPRYAVADDAPTHEQIAALIERMGDSQFAAREAAVAALIKIGLPAADQLDHAAISHADPEVRARAKVALRRIGPTHCWPQPPRFDRSRVKEIVQRKGVIVSDETWTADKTYHVTEKLVVAPPAMLSIEPGAIVLFSENAGLEIQVTAYDRRKEARLLARSDDSFTPIIFTSFAEWQGKDGHWGKLVTSGPTHLENVQIRRSSGVEWRTKRYGWALFSVGIYNTAGDGLTLADDSMGFHGDVTVRSAIRGIVSDNDNGTHYFDHVRVSDVSTGVEFGDGVYHTLASLRIDSAKQDGLRLHRCYPSIGQLSIQKCGVGWRESRGAHSYMENVTISDCIECAAILESNSIARNLRIRTQKGDGLIVRGGDPALEHVVIHDVNGVGVVLERRALPYFGTLKITDCQTREQQVESDSKIQKWSNQQEREWNNHIDRRVWPSYRKQVTPSEPSNWRPSKSADAPRAKPGK